MTKGSKGNPTRPRNNDHRLTGASSPTTTSHITGNTPTPTSTPNDPGDTWTGTLDSFNNFGDGAQKFDDATINSGASQNRTRSVHTNTCSGTVRSFNNGTSGSQDFMDATIKSGSSRESNILVDNNFAGFIGNLFRKLMEPVDPVLHCSGTLNSFNNLGSGVQNFKGANIISGAN